jgi:hypothetical protein
VRALAPATVDALRQVPNAPGLQFKVYLAVWDIHTEPAEPSLRVTNVSDLVVMDSLGSIDWTLERGYAQLTPGDIQFKVRDFADTFEGAVRACDTYGSPCEVQIWAAPAWGGAGDWAMLFHGYLEPSGINRAAAEPGGGAEPTVPIKDVYAKSYLGRMDAIRVEPLRTWSGTMTLENLIKTLGGELIADAGHEPIDYDIQVAMIPPKDGRLVLSTWQDTHILQRQGISWVIGETSSYWSILQWVAYNRTLVWIHLCKRTFSVLYSRTISLGPDLGADVAQFLHFGPQYVALVLSKREDLAPAQLYPNTCLPLILKKVIVLDRANPVNHTRWIADDHQGVVSDVAGRMLGYCAATAYNGEPTLAVWCDRVYNEEPFAALMYGVATISLTALRTDQDPEFSGCDGATTGNMMVGGAGAIRNGAGTWYFYGCKLAETDKHVHLTVWRSTDGRNFVVDHEGAYLTTLPGSGANWRIPTANVEIGRQAGSYAILQNWGWAYHFPTDGAAVALADGAPSFLVGCQDDKDVMGPECIGLVSHSPHLHLVHYSSPATYNLIEDFYTPGSPDTLQITGVGGYFAKLNWVAYSLRGNGDTGWFWTWRNDYSQPMMLIYPGFWPAFDLDAAGPAADESVRSFLGRIAEATGHMILFPGRLTTNGNLIWRIRPRHTQPPQYTLSARDILAVGIEVQGARKLRLVVTTQGVTYAYPASETLALARLSELGINNDGIPPSVADDFAYWLWQLFDTQNRVVKCETDAAIWVEVGDSVDLPLGLVDYFQGVVARQSLSSVTGRGQVELLCAVATPGTRLTPIEGSAT